MDKKLKQIYKNMKIMQSETKKHRAYIESTTPYKNCVKWSKEDLAYCKVKYQYLAGKKQAEINDLQEEIKELKRDIGRMTLKYNTKVINPKS